MSHSLLHARMHLFLWRVVRYRSLTRNSSVNSADFMTTHASRTLKWSLIHIWRTAGIYILCQCIHKWLLLVNIDIYLLKKHCLPVFWSFETYNGHRSDSTDNGNTPDWNNKLLFEVNFHRYFSVKTWRFDILYEPCLMHVFQYENTAN